MTRRRRLTEAEDVLSGRTGPEHGRLAHSLDEIREVYTATTSADTRAAHLAAMASAYQPVSAARPAARRRRSGLVLRTGAIAAGLVLATGTALAATGSLPDAAQDAVADVVSSVGVDLPGGNDDTRETQAPAEAGKAGAEANKAEAEQFTTAKKAWTECVGEKAPAHEGSGRFDPVQACGPKPERSPAPKATDRPAPGPASADRPGNARPEKPERTHDVSKRPADAGPPESAGRSADRTQRSVDD